MVYFIQSGADGGPVKIGCVDGEHYDAVLLRLSLLQVGNPEQLSVIGVKPGGVEEERRLHRLFANGRIRGEWYRAGTAGLGHAIERAREQETVRDWQSRDDGLQLCDWTGVVRPPRRRVCSDRCVRERRTAEQRERRAAA